MRMISSVAVVLAATTSAAMLGAIADTETAASARHALPARGLDVVRTADITERGLKPTDFPRITTLTDEAVTAIGKAGLTEEATTALVELARHVAFRDR